MPGDCGEGMEVSGKATIMRSPSIPWVRQLYELYELQADSIGIEPLTCSITPDNGPIHVILIFPFDSYFLAGDNGTRDTKAHSRAAHIHNNARMVLFRIGEAKGITYFLLRVITGVSSSFTCPYVISFGPHDFNTIFAIIFCQGYISLCQAGDRHVELPAQ